MKARRTGTAAAWWASWLFLLIGATARAATEAPADDTARAIDDALVAVQAAAEPGPRTVPLGDQALLDLPAGYAYVPVAAAARLLEAMGNSTGPGFHGLVVGEHLRGFVVVGFDAAGYIADDDARAWDADALLDRLRENTEAGNAERRERRIPEFTVAGWIEPPTYEPGNQRLVWAAEVVDKGPGDGRPHGVNYNTYQLGREGYMSLNLVSDTEAIGEDRHHARTLLAALRFNEGKRYADFDAATDKVAEYGLAALVGGLAAKKLGLFAAAGLLLAKSWKLIAVLAVAAIAGMRRLRRRPPAGDDGSV